MNPRRSEFCNNACLTANYRITERVNLTASVTMSKFLGDAKDSPIVFDDTQGFSFIGISYRFD